MTGNITYKDSTGVVITVTGADLDYGVHVLGIADPEGEWTVHTECEGETDTMPYIGERPLIEERK